MLGKEAGGLSSEGAPSRREQILAARSPRAAQVRRALVSAPGSTRCWGSRGSDGPEQDPWGREPRGGGSSCPPLCPQGLGRELFLGPLSSPCEHSSSRYFLCGSCAPSGLVLSKQHEPSHFAYKETEAHKLPIFL